MVVHHIVMRHILTPATRPFQVWLCRTQYAPNYPANLLEPKALLPRRSAASIHIAQEFLLNIACLHGTMVCLCPRLKATPFPLLLCQLPSCLQDPQTSLPPSLNNEDAPPTHRVAVFGPIPHLLLQEDVYQREDAPTRSESL